MGQRLVLVFIMILSLSLGGCVAGVGLQSYVDAEDGYEFLYPNGWVPVEVNSGPDVVFRDLVERSENVSLMMSPVPKDRLLQDLGDATEVGYRLSKSAIAPPDSGRVAELVSAESRQAKGKTYYLLEYAVKLKEGGERHNFASVAISRGKLFTFNLSTPERRWQKAQETFRQTVESFTVY
ncbi:photosystem II reaction center PsbP [Oscillatoria amoena NRMC-F 0135]|nr:photosystem II reaction center PsbP [Geitlerinema splendidum]MDL5047403.1 photosystem II reaction center PsbP [Oscillatoria amoena NRMC-F 0135]